ncbi:MAG: alanine racemase [Acidimicrobiia bacterium]
MTFAPSAVADPSRVSYALIDPDAITHNVEVLRRAAAPAGLWAVVKADGYGHGSVTAARAALAGGADGLAVALVGEGERLRAEGVGARVLVLSEPPLSHMARVVASRLEPTVYSLAAIETAAHAAEAAAGSGPLPVHLKVDTGMHRAGCDRRDAVDLAVAISRQPKLHLASVWTHCAVADEPGNPFTAEQLERFAEVRAAIGAAGVQVEHFHMANSAATLVHPEARGSFVRCGIAIYGLLPSNALAPWCGQLRPAMSVRSEVSFVRRVPAGEGISYGLRYAPERDATIATVPLGYADGVTRRLGKTDGEVLIGGRRRRIAGTITMDQLMVDCGDDAVVRGDEVVLIGRQGDEVITVEQWADRLDTITYEVTCGFGARLPRRLAR